MTPTPRRRLALALMALLAGWLSASVFLWGTQYKTSLYPEHRSSWDQVPFAKLLSERERPSEAHFTSADTLLKASGACLVGVFLLSRAGHAARRGLKASKLSLPPLPSPRELPFLFILWSRPPPLRGW